MKFPSSYQPHWNGSANRTYVHPDSIWKKSVEVVPLAPMGQTTPIIQTPSLLAYLARLTNQKKKKKNRCTSSKDTECHCKPGTFRGEDAPEFCQKCSTGCPDGKVMVMNCTPWSNVKCVDQESGTSPLVTNIFTGLGITVVITFVLIGCVVCCFSKDSGCPACSHRPGALCSVSVPGEGGAARGPSPPLSGVSSLRGCFGSGALDHAHNNRLTSGDSLSILVPWQEKKLTEDNGQSQDEASRESGGLKLFFSDFAAISPL